MKGTQSPSRQGTFDAPSLLPCPQGSCTAPRRELLRRELAQRRRQFRGRQTRRPDLARGLAAPQQAGFTLVELLVVIAIIGILIALLVPAVGGAIRAAKNGVIALEITELAKAVERYKMEFGDYPPDLASTDADDAVAIKNHVSRKFRTRNPLLDSQDAKGNFAHLDPAEALVFWLRGFSSDPMRPVMGNVAPPAGDYIEYVNGAGRKPLFDFKQTQLNDADGDGFPEYYPPNGTKPYVYFHHSDYMGVNTLAGSGTGTVLVGPNSNSLLVRPYYKVAPPATVKDYVEPLKFQIICAGLDNEFGDPTNGNGGVYPNGPYSDQDEDNLTNFSEGKTLEAAMP